MTRCFALFGAALLICCSSSRGQPGAGQPDALAVAFVAAPLPDAEVQPLAGGAGRSIAEITRGRVAVIDLYASWCKPCREVSKNVELLAAAHRHTDLLVVGLNVGEDRAAAASFFDGKQPPYDVYLDATFRVPDGLGQKELPTVLIVDRDGQVRLARRKVDASVLKLVDELLAVPPS